ncbi:MAG TPA: hypothetical protein VHL59_20200 [Thermoanaerobaculia bacterium]|nr:hypothetical protein [Thermoanaerobaculia bacterium]
MTAADRTIAVGLFILAFVAYAWFFGGGGWNQNAQFDLTRALVERQTLHIDGYRVNTGDLSWSAVGGEWHAYINKPPGVSLLGAIPYALVYGIERAMNVSVDSWQMMTINAWLVTVFTCALTGALIPAVLYRYARRRTDASPRTAVCVALAIAFGTIVWPYSTMLFAHVPSALFLLLAFVWLDERPLLAGIAAGLAGVCFYLCIVAAAVLALGALLRSRRKALLFVAGGAPFGVLLGVYHYLCFGSPFRTSVEASRNFTEEGLLFGVFRMPSAQALWGITFTEYRGLFFYSPVLLLAFAGAFVMIRRRVMLRELAMVGAIVIIFFLSVTSFNGWSGGSAFGPRYVLSVIPLMGIPLLFVRWRALVLTLGAVSFALQFIATSVDPMPDTVMPHPLRMYLWPAFRDGRVPEWTVKKIELPHAQTGKTSINRQSIDELGPRRSYKPGSRESTWAAFNLGELVTGPGTRGSVVPVFLWIVAGSALLLRFGAPPARRPFPPAAGRRDAGGSGRPEAGAP